MTTILARITQTRFLAILGLTITAIGVGIVVYTEFVRSENTAVSFELITESNVFEVPEDLSGLEVVFEGEDITQTGRRLRVFTVRISNSGGSDILSAHFDPNIGWGLRASEAEILEVELVDASSSYLRDAFTLDVQPEEQIRFPSVILETGESVTIKVLVIHSLNQSPTIEPIGKIAGVHKFSLEIPQPGGGEESFVEEAFGGSALVQITRLAPYAIGSVLALVVIVIPAALLTISYDSRQAKRKYSRFIRQYRESQSSEPNDKVDRFLRFLSRRNDDSIGSIKRAFEDPKNIEDTIRNRLALMAELKKSPVGTALHTHLWSEGGLTEFLLEIDAAEIQDDGEVTFDQSLTDELLLALHSIEDG